MKAFLTIPFFRISIPFITGLLCGLRYSLPSISWIYFATMILMMSIAIFFIPTSTISKRICLILMDLFLFLYAINLVSLTDHSKQASFYGKYVKAQGVTGFIAVIDELPVEKEKSFKLSLQLLEIKSGAGYHKTNGSIVAYFKKSKTTGLLKPGNVLLIMSKLQNLQAPMNPFEFNYKTYLANRQFYHTTFVDSTAYFVLHERVYLNPAWKLGLTCKAFILKKLKSSALSANSYAICAALLTGYDDEINKSVMDAFSHSGTLHVLSVSGLHTGLIYLVLAYLFDLVDRKKKYKLTKFIFITAILWCFALITGFSSPVLRAVIMFNLLGLGKIYFRNDSGNQMNILLVSAFALLLYNPFFITDVGFQLSYFALAGLIFFQPKLSSLFTPSNYILNSTWQSISASVAATISTLPLTLLYFKQFPLWFFICNLMVVPATFVILLLAVLLVLHLNFAAVLINVLIEFLIAFINLFNSENYGFVDMINFNTIDALALAALIVLLSCCIQYRSYRMTLYGLSLLICWQCYSLWGSFDGKSMQLFTVYAIRNKNILTLKDRKHVFVNVAKNADYNFHVKPHLISFYNPVIKEGAFNYLSTGYEGILILDKPDCWPVSELKGVTTLVLANNFNMSGKDLQRFPALKVIVSGSSNNSFTSKKTGELCRKFGLDFYDTAQAGAYLLSLN